MDPATSADIVSRRSRLRWFWSVLTLVTCGAVLWGCASVLIIPMLDTDLSADEAQWVIEQHEIRTPDSFELVSMRRFGCPGLAPGGCGYVGSYTGPAEQFPDYRSIFTDPTYHQPLRKVTCAELKKQVGFESTKRGDNDWKFDCTNAIELFASTPYEGTSHDYPELTLARDSQFATIYFYQRQS